MYRVFWKLLFEWNSPMCMQDWLFRLIAREMFELYRRMYNLWLTWWLLYLLLGLLFIWLIMFEEWGAFGNSGRNFGRVNSDSYFSLFWCQNNKEKEEFRNWRRVLKFVVICIHFGIYLTFCLFFYVNLINFYKKDVHIKLETWSFHLSYSSVYSTLFNIYEFANKNN